MLGLIKGGAKALVSHNITVNGYGPGVVATELWKQLDKDLVEIGMFEKQGQSMDSLAENMILMRRSPTRRTCRGPPHSWQVPKVTI